MRKRVTWMSIASVLLGGLLTVLLVSTAIGGPTTNVKLQSLQSEGTARPGETVRLMAKLDDPDLRIRRFEAAMVSPDGLDRLPVRFFPAKSAGVWRAEVALQPMAMPGDWTLSELSATEDTGLAVTFTSPVKVTVLDVLDAPPAGSVLRIPKGQFRETQIVPVGVRLPDGIASRTIALRLTGPNGQFSEQRWGLAQPAAGSETEVPLRLPRGLGMGTWRITRLMIEREDGTWVHYRAGRDFAGTLPVTKGKVDTAPPSVSDVLLSAEPAQTGRPVNVSVKAEDDYAGVAYVLATLLDPTGRSYGVSSLALTDDGRWAGELVSPLYAPAGEWSVRIYAADAAGNAMSEPAARSIQLGAGHAEPSRPAVKEVQLAVTPGELTATVRLNGDVPAAQLAVKVEGPDLVQPVYLGMNDLGDGRWGHTLALPDKIPSGAWRITEVRLIDTLGREAGGTLSELSLPETAVPFVNANGDAAAPSLDAVTVTAAVSRGARLRVEVAATDTGAGIEQVRVRLAGPSGGQLMVPLQWSEEDGRWVGTAIVTDAVEAGTWQVASVYLRDAAWNSVFAEPAQEVSFSVR